MNHSKQITADYIKAHGNSLQIALDAVCVIPPDEVENMPAGWWVVANADGAIAAFANEDDAFSFRLVYINSILNP